MIFKMIFRSLMLAAILLPPQVNAEPAKLRFPPECVLNVIAKKRNVTLSSNVPAPQLHFESSTPFDDFKRAVAPQGANPTEFSNFYAFTGDYNDIFLMDNEDYYRRHARGIDDSLAHELVHFIQVKYQKYDLFADDMAELEAVELQTWFRETFLNSTTPRSPCD